MNCEEAREYMSLYFDKELDRNLTEILMAHLQNCSGCKKEFQQMKDILDELNHMELIDLPEGFHQEIMEKLEAEKIEPIHKNVSKAKEGKKVSWKKYSAIAAGFLAVVVIGGSIGGLRMGSMGAGTASMPPRYQEEKGVVDNGSLDGAGFALNSAAESPRTTAATSAPMETAGGETADIAMDTRELPETEKRLYSEEKSISSTDESTERLKIKRFNATLEVASFDESVEALRNSAQSSGGYVESLDSYIYHENAEMGISLKEGNMVIRIPSEKYEQSKELLSQLGKVTNENESTEDITADYVDTEGRLKMKKLEEERLLTLIETCTTVEDMIKIEERLAEVRTDIETYTSALNNWDRLVKFSTIRLHIYEAGENTLTSVDPAFHSRVKNSFIGSINHFVWFCQDLVVFLAGNIIIVPILAAAILIVVLFVKRRKKKNEKKDL